MADITMCPSKTCPRRESCYRALAKPDRLQSYTDFTEWCRKTDEYYWSVDQTDTYCKSDEWAHIGISSYIR